MNETEKISKGKGEQGGMESLIWFIGFVVFYFALQLWILPKLGIPT